MAREISAFLVTFLMFAAATVGTVKWEQRKKQLEYERTFEQRLAAKMENKAFAQKWHKTESFDQIRNFLLTPYNLKSEKEKRLKVKVQKAVNL